MRYFFDILALLHAGIGETITGGFRGGMGAHYIFVKEN